MELSKSSLPSAISLRMSSPKSVFCQANHGRVKREGSSLWNDSWMKPVPASVSTSIWRQWRNSASSVEVKARIMIDIGHTIS